MNFKLFWKKTNRGLWLGLALLVGLAVFIIAGEISFGLQKKEIRATAKNYVEELLAVNLAEGNLGTDGYLTEAQKKAQKETLAGVAEKYWYSGSLEINSRNYNLARLGELLSQWQREVPGKVEGYSYRSDDWEVEITRDGPGRVLITLTTDEIEVRGVGAAPKEGFEDGVLFPTPVAGGRAFGEEDGSNAEWHATCKLYFSLELVRRGGKWQVAGMNANVGSGYYYNYGLLGMLE